MIGERVHIDIVARTRFKDPVLSLREGKVQNPLSCEEREQVYPYSKSLGWFVLWCGATFVRERNGNREELIRFAARFHCPYIFMGNGIMKPYRGGIYVSVERMVRRATHSSPEILVSGRRGTVRSLVVGAIARRVAAEVRRRQE